MVHAAWIAGLLAAATSAHPTAGSTTQSRRRDADPPANISSFLDVPSSSELKWVPCYDKFQCANLEVPLDYEDPAVGTTIVAWIRHNAVNGAGKDVLFNPGGPGGSGVRYILAGGGDRIREMIGSKYNVVSFDPRGVNASGIDLTCFPDHPEIREEYSPNPKSNYKEAYAERTALGKFCSAVNQNTTVRYGGTVAVVQDMMHFTELQAALNGEEKPAESLINYIGASYGTVIGQTLGALYPNRIGRLINAANVDGAAYYNGLDKNMASDADKALRYFFDLCHEAGEKKCPFASNSSNAQELEAKFDKLLEHLDKEPLQRFDPSSGLPGIVTSDNVRNVLYNGLYTPTKAFPLIGMGLAALEAGNVTAWEEVMAMADPKIADGPFNYTSNAQEEVLQFVYRIDSAGRYEIKNVDEYLRVVDEIKATSKWFGEGYAKANPLVNAGSSIMPPQSQYFAGFQNTKTKNPVLFVNTNADPATPLASAKKMAGFFEGSGLLTQNSAGHSLFDVKSACTYQHVQTYMEMGKVPEQGTVCELEKKPFSDEVVKRDVINLGVVRL